MFHRLCPDPSEFLEQRTDKRKLGKLWSAPHVQPPTAASSSGKASVASTQHSETIGKVGPGGEDPRQPGSSPTYPRSSRPGRVFSKHPGGIAVRDSDLKEGPGRPGGDLRGTWALQDGAQFSRCQCGLTRNTEDWRLSPTFLPHPMPMYPESP